MRSDNGGQSHDDIMIQRLLETRTISPLDTDGMSIRKVETVGHEIFWRPWRRDKKPGSIECYGSRNASRFGALREFVRDRRAWDSVYEFLGVRVLEKLHWEDNTLD